MTKKILIAAVILIVAVGGWAIISSRPAEDVSDSDSDADVLYFNDGVVSAVSSGEISVRMPDATVETYAVATSSRFSRIEKDATAVPGEPVVIVYSKHLEKPVAAVISKPFESSDPADALDIFAGTLVSVEGNVVTVSLEDGEREFAFESQMPFTKVVDVEPSQILVGESIEARYVEEVGKRIILNGFLRLAAE